MDNKEFRFLTTFEMTAMSFRQSDEGTTACPDVRREGISINQLTK